MPRNLDLLLAERLSRVSRAQQAGTYLISAVFHGALALGFLFIPKLLAEPPEQVTYVSMTVVTQAALGIDEPEPPRPPAPRREPEPARPEPPKPEPEPADDVPVLRTEKAVEKPAASPPPERPSPPAAATAPTDPPKRKGSPFGSALGVSTSTATLGVEDPDFTYGYYLNRVVTAISGNWVRPPVGSGIGQAIFYFRIQRGGEITDLRLSESSTSERFDEAAQRAIASSSPLAPLPRGYKRDYLGINLIVK
ncbi:MAG: TonB C-terminal domain-containing protein [bacterium]|nr:TonB C-terminal domain-containing protein [bacterium]